MGPVDLKPQYVINDRGERTAVILTIEEYEEIADLLDDLADAEELDRRRAEPDIPHDEAMRMVKRDGEIPD